MSKLVSAAKLILEKNSNLLTPIRYIPYSVRLGKSYKQHQKLITWYETATAQEKERFHYEKLNHIVNHAYSNIPFYNEFYDKQGYQPSAFKSLGHFADVPVISKDDLRAYELENR